MICWGSHRIEWKFLSAFAVWCFFWLQIPPHCFAGGEGTVITTFKELFEGPISPDTQARVPAIATYIDPTWRTLYVQDDTGGCLIRHDMPYGDLRPGDRLLVEGQRLDPGATNPLHVLRNVTVRRTGTGPLPAARPASAADLESHDFVACRVQVQGTVRALNNVTRMQLHLKVGEKMFSAFVRQPPAQEVEGLLDAEVTLQGICNQEGPAADGRPVGTSLFVEDFQSILIRRRGPAQPFALEPTPVSRLADQVGQTERRTLVRGRVTEQKQAVSVTLQDDTGSVLALSPLLHPLTPGALVEAIGFPEVEAGVTVLKEVQFQEISAPRSGPSISAAGSPQAAPKPALDSIKKILEQTRQQIRQELSLQVTGVVTRFDPVGKTFFIQDGEAAIFGGPMLEEQILKPGQVIEVIGVTKPGDLLPMISPAKVTVLREGKMPEAPLIAYHNGISGIFDCRRVRVQGVVQSAFWSGGLLNLDLVAADGRFWCTLPAPPDTPYRTNLINAFVELEGVCIVTLDSLGTPSHLQIALQLESDIRVQRLATVREYQPLSMDISEFTGFLNPDRANARIKIRGVATCWQPGRELYLQDETGAICARTTDQTNRVEIGDTVEVVGFRAMGESAPILQHAEYQVVSNGVPPDAMALKPGEALDLGYRNKLVQIEARLLENVSASAAPELLLEDDSGFFTARLEPREGGPIAPAWRKGSRLRVTGICILRLDEARTPRAFRLLLRSPADVEVLKSPPWFTTPRIVASALFLMVAVIATLGWVAALRRRVAEQTDQIRRRLESEAATERRLALVWEASADGMRMSDASGLVIQVNQAYCQMTQKERSELEGHPYWKPFQNGNQKLPLAEYQKFFQNRSAPNWHTFELVLWNGQNKWFELAYRFIERAGSEPLLLAQFRDITERKRAEEATMRLQEQLAQSQKTESIGRLAGGVAHDFNNMLQVVLGNTLLALDEVPAGSPLHEALQEVKNSAQRSADLTKQLLAFARKQTAAPRVLDLNATVAGMLSMLRRLIGESIELRWNPGGQLPLVKIDPTQIDQILANLAVNARDAIVAVGGVGTIMIATSQVEYDATFCADHPSFSPGRFLLLTVSDTGCGMSKEVQDRLFEPFFTTKGLGAGTGLGLATVYGIVKQNGGVINVYSEPKHGAAFKIYLPACDSQEVSAPHARPVRPPPGQLETILVVEDDPALLRMTQKHLVNLGYTVLAARRPGEAIRLAEEHTGKINLLMTDVVMPEMNGRDLAQRLTANCPQLRQLYMSGYTADVIAHQGVLEEGVNYLAKPFTVQELAVKVHTALYS